MNRAHGAGARLANAEAYELWADSYPPVPHNPLMRAEQRAMLELWPGLAGAEARALDLACGSGRYAALLAGLGVPCVVAMDLSAAMLRKASSAGLRVRADMMHLPFADRVFDAVVSGLAAGHAPGLVAWMREIARVLKPGGVLLYSDFHPQAAAAGMTRSFTDAGSRKHVLHHRRYDVRAHRRAAAVAGLRIEASREVRVGVELDETFPGSVEFYRRWHGLAVVYVVRVRK